MTATILTTSLRLVGIKVSQKTLEKTWLSPGIKPRTSRFIYQYSNHSVMTTLNFNFRVHTISLG